MNFIRGVRKFTEIFKKYPADKNVVYAHYLIAIVHYEQISDERKDLKPLLDAKEKLNFLKEYPNTDYAIDLRFKYDLIFNQLAAKSFLLQSIILPLKSGYLLSID